MGYLYPQKKLNILYSCKENKLISMRTECNAVSVYVNTILQILHTQQSHHKMTLDLVSILF